MTQLTLFPERRRSIRRYPDVPGAVCSSETSQAAAESVCDSADTLRARVLEAIRTRGGATCDELEVALNMRHQTASARLTELGKLGRIVPNGKRDTRSGRKAVVWEVTQ